MSVSIIPHRRAADEGLARSLESLLQRRADPNNYPRLRLAERAKVECSLNGSVQTALGGGVYCFQIKHIRMDRGGTI